MKFIAAPEDAPRMLGRAVALLASTCALILVVDPIVFAPLFDVLGVSETATPWALDTANRTLAAYHRTFDPDQNSEFVAQRSRNIQGWAIIVYYDEPDEPRVGALLSTLDAAIAVKHELRHISACEKMCDLSDLEGLTMSCGISDLQRTYRDKFRRIQRKSDNSEECPCELSETEGDASLDSFQLLERAAPPRGFGGPLPMTGTFHSGRPRG